MTELEGFQTYRVLLRRKVRLVRIPIKSFPVWGSEIYLGRWAEYDGNSLREEYGQRWATELQDILDRGFIAVHGLKGSGRPVVLADGLKVGATQAEVVRGRRAGSGIDTLIRHLHVEEQIADYEELVRLILSDGPSWAKATLKRWVPDGLSSTVALERLKPKARKANARGKAPHEAHCSYCESGLPKRLNDALMARKRP